MSELFRIKVVCDKRNIFDERVSEEEDLQKVFDKIKKKFG